MVSGTSQTSMATTGTASPTASAVVNSDSDGGMTSGAKIGMGVGVAVAGIAIGVLAAMLYFVYRKRKQRRAGLQFIMPVPTHVDTEKQYPPSRPAAGGMGANITHRGDFDWQNISEEAYEDPSKAPLSPNLNSIGPVGYYGPESDNGSSRSQPLDRERRQYSWGSNQESAGGTASSTAHLTGDREQSTSDPGALPAYTNPTGQHFEDSKGPAPRTSDRNEEITELPTNDSFRRPRQNEYELPAQSSYKPRHGPGPGAREVDEQKFLLMDVEMVKLRQQKQKQSPNEAQAVSPVESMGETSRLHRPREQGG